MARKHTPVFFFGRRAYRRIDGELHAAPIDGTGHIAAEFREVMEDCLRERRAFGFKQEPFVSKMRPATIMGGSHVEGKDSA